MNALERRLAKLEQAIGIDTPRVAVLLTAEGASEEAQERHRQAVADAEQRGEEVFVIKLVPALPERLTPRSNGAMQRGRDARPGGQRASASEEAKNAG